MELTHSFSSIKMYENCPKRYYHQRVTKEVKDLGGEATVYGERIHEALEHRLGSKTKLPDEAKGYEVLCRTIENINGSLYVEQQLCLNEYLTPTGWWDKDAWIRSILDVLIIKDNKAIVMDWKTGKRRPDFTQLELFALQVFKHFEHVEEVTASFLWLKDMSKDNMVYESANANLMWESLLTRIERITDSAVHNKWPPKPSGLCRYCPAKNICEYALN